MAYRVLKAFRYGGRDFRPGEAVDADWERRMDHLEWLARRGLVRVVEGAAPAGERPAVRRAAAEAGGRALHRRPRRGRERAAASP